tara:strand:+ start:87 stop:353 length:267 start_codon:yes stop_codon:yes gene_type:complete
MEDIDYSDWDKLNVYQKCITYGRLLAMQELQEQMSCIQESFTRLLKVNGVEGEEYFKNLCREEDEKNKVKEVEEVEVVEVVEVATQTD